MFQLSRIDLFQMSLKHINGFNHIPPLHILMVSNLHLLYNMKTKMLHIDNLACYCYTVGGSIYFKGASIHYYVTL